MQGMSFRRGWGISVIRGNRFGFLIKLFFCIFSFFFLIIGFQTNAQQRNGTPTKHFLGGGAIKKVSQIGPAFCSHDENVRRFFLDCGQDLLERDTGPENRSV